MVLLNQTTKPKSIFDKNNMENFNKFMKNILFDQKKIVFFIFFIFLAIGIKSVNDYGVSSDEYNSRLKGFVTLNYIGEKIAPEFTKKYKQDKNFTSLHETKRMKYYGVVFETPAALIETILGIKSKNNQFLFKHYINFIIFFISLIFFYRLLNNRFDNWKLSLLGVAMIFLSPRIFANSFYNNKDIIFLSFFIFSLYYAFHFIDKPTKKNIVLSSLFCALAIDIRLVGVICPVILFIIYFFVELKKKEKIKNILKILITYSLFLFAFITIFWPYLWSNPIMNFYEAFVQMSNYPHDVYNLFNGEYESSKNLPVYYIPIWIIFTIPILYIILFFIGTFFIIKSFLEKKNNIKDLLIFLILFSVIIVVIFLKSTFYNGWRQLYFLYPLIIYLSILATLNLFNIFKNNSKLFLIFIFLISFFNTSYWMIKNHPHQYVYFNFLAGENFNEKFEMDYWGLSYKKNIEFLLDYQKVGKINLFNLSDIKLYYPLLGFNNNDRNRINVVESPEQADYFMTNYYYINPNRVNSFSTEKLKILNEIKVDGISINTLFRK